MEQSQFNIEFLGETLNGLYIKDKTKALEIIQKLSKVDAPFGFDIETMAHPAYKHERAAPLDPLRSRPRLVQLYSGRNVVVFDLFHIGSTEFLKEFLSSKKLIAHNALFEIQHLIQNFKVNEFDVGCTLLATKLIYHAKTPDDGGLRADLGTVVKQVLKTDIWKDISHQYWGEPELNFEQVQYAAYDAVTTLKVAEKLSIGLRKLGMIPIYRLYKEAQKPLALMQLNGMKIDVEKHLTMIAKWKSDAWNAKKELTVITGLTDLTSHKMSDYLEQNLAPETLAIWPRTETGKLSTDSKTFSDFDYIDVVEPFSRFQKATTLCSTFGTSLQQKLSEVDNKFHTSFKLGGARTGRLSSSKPNLQNAPRSKEFRSIFIAEKNKSLIVADFNQIELRVAAELSGDIEMNRAFREGLDLHAMTAEAVSGKKWDTMTEEEQAWFRQNAKALNFGLLFGLGSPGYRKYAKKQYKVNLTETEAFDSVRAWHVLYSGYTAYQKNQAETCKAEMTVRTKTGKLRRLNEDNYYGASANTPVQGTASEIMLHALCFLAKELPTCAKLINTVHDEIVVQCKKGKEKEITDTVIACMTKGYKVLFPYGLTKNLVTAGIGNNWASAK